ncbi:MAG: MetQ/NlpA family ABC transporter substrate-binding protein [Firmicutes bacterium]|nr:MetQ/NlpA family ABC transporter substrate-binding protein [Bacillota bacterium]
MKKLFAFVLTLVIAASVLGFGFAATGCDDGKTITVGASVTPHALILNQLKTKIEEKGFRLVVREFNDYILPNTALQNGDINANFFQHVPYLNEFNSKNGTALVPIANVHYEPLGIYAGKTATLDALTEGTKIGIPNDSSNGARALRLLERERLITFDAAAGASVSKLDILDNPFNVDIVEIEAAQLPAQLPDLAIAVINGNYALGAGLKTAITVENADVAANYVNVIAVKAGNETSAKTNALIEALLEADLATYVAQEFGAPVVLSLKDLRIGI